MSGASLGSESSQFSFERAESASEASRQSASPSPTRRRSPRKITVTSGKGGVGKSSCSCSLAIGLAKRGAKVLLFDADLQLANLDLLMGIQPEFTLQDVVKGTKSISEVLCTTHYGVKVICGGSAIAGLMTAGPKKLARFYEGIDEIAAEFDYVIFDTGAGVDSKVMSFVGQADEVILVTTPDPASITDSYAVVKTVAKKHPGKHIEVVFNSVGGQQEAASLFRILNETTVKFLKTPLSFLGMVRHDDTLRAAVRARKPVIAAFPQAPSAIDLDQAAAELDRRSAA